MGFTLGKKSTRVFRSIGRKSTQIARAIGSKMPSILSHASNYMNVAGQIGSSLSGVALMLGQPEIAAPLMATSVGLQAGGRAASGLSDSSRSAKKGNYSDAAQSLEKTAIQANKDYKNNKFG